MSQKVFKKLKSYVQSWAKVKQENLHFSWIVHDLHSAGTQPQYTVTGGDVMKIPSQLVKFPLYGLEVQ
jgi:hypothetical protein